MSGDLRKDLGKSQNTDKQQTEEARRKAKEEYAERDRIKTEENWRFWNDALEAYANGWKPSGPRHWVVIDPDTDIATVEILQELAGMTAMPKVFNTRYTGFDGDEDINQFVPLKNGKPKEVQAVEVSHKEIKRVGEKTEDCSYAMNIWNEDHKLSNSGRQGGKIDGGGESLRLRTQDRA